MSYAGDEELPNSSKRQRSSVTPDSGLSESESRDEKDKTSETKSENQSLDGHSGLTSEELEEILNSGAVAGDRDFMWEVIDATKDSAKEKLASIEARIATKEWFNASRHCHTLKGSTAMLCMNKLWSACLAAETALKAMDKSATELDETSSKALSELRLQIGRLLKTVDEAG